MQAEDSWSRPIRPSDQLSNGGERGETLAAVVEPGFQHDDLMDFAMPGPGQPCARLDLGPCRVARTIPHLFLAKPDEALLLRFTQAADRLFL